MNLASAAIRSRNIGDLDGGAQVLIESYGGKSLREQSRGESFLSLVEHRFESMGCISLTSRKQMIRYLGDWDAGEID